VREPVQAENAFMDAFFLPEFLLPVALGGGEEGNLPTNLRAAEHPLGFVFFNLLSFPVWPLVRLPGPPHNAPKKSEFLFFPPHFHSLAATDRMEAEAVGFRRGLGGGGGSLLGLTSFHGERKDATYISRLVSVGGGGGGGGLGGGVGVVGRVCCVCPRHSEGVGLIYVVCVNSLGIK